MEENMKFGRYCKSGMAVIYPEENKMQCVKIASIKTNIDGYAASQAKPA
jgi:hypothetical protein